MNKITFALVAGLVLVLFVLASGNSVWAQNQCYGTVPCARGPIGVPGGNFVYGSASLSVPVGAVPDGSTISMYRPPLGGLPTGTFRTFGNNLVAMVLTGPDGNPITNPSAPITVCFTLTAQQVSDAGGPGNIVIEWWNTARGLWPSLTTTPGTVPNQFCTSTSQL